MKIKKNGKIINLTEGDLKRIVKRVIIEQKKVTVSPSRQSFLDKLSKIDPEAAVMVKNKTTEVKVSKKHVLSYVWDEESGAGDLYIFKVTADNGFPFIHSRISVIDRASEGSSADDIMIGGRLGKFTLNDNWDNLDEIKTQDVINGGIQFIQNNLTKFKQEYHKITRSEKNIKRFWNDNPQTFDRSQYGIWGGSTTGNALKVIELVQDDELIQHIDFKIENFRSNGKYPELTIPPAA